ncbi:MAG: hypothetical protein LAO31_22905, partial [Acidobacteriia bacterium]|nr:hypothetical protein [Terriglobia bacterium]
MPQSLAQILVHIVFSTQSRYKFLADYEIRQSATASMTTQKSRQDSPGRPGAVLLLLKGHVENGIKSPDDRGSFFGRTGT